MTTQKPTRTAEKAKERLIDWDELPQWQRDNEHIVSGYRQASGSLERSILSIFAWHNETVNIWTHLLPGCLSIPFGYFLWSMLQPRYENFGPDDLKAFACFFVAVFLCLVMSGTYHMISNLSPSVKKTGQKLDHLGIVVLITGSFIPSIHLGFSCERGLAQLYWGMICSLGIACGAVTVLPSFRTPGWRPLRAAMFVLMGLSAIVPVIHGLSLYGLQEMNSRIGLSWLVLQGFLYIIGAVIYAARVPERLRRKQFDLLGSSHQIFHVMVVLAAVCHLVGLLKAFDYRHSFVGGLCK